MKKTVSTSRKPHKSTEKRRRIAINYAIVPLCAVAQDPLARSAFERQRLGSLNVVLGIAGMTVAAYALFFLYDWLTVRRPSVPSAPLFALAFALNVAAAALLLISQVPAAPKDGVFFAGLTGALLFGIALIWALFFALPKGTYASPQVGRTCFKQGMYALCRHPGVLWYCLAFAFLALMLRTPESALSCAILCAGDVAYMLLQDAWTFPSTFSDYRDYRATTPLLLPNAVSLRAALRPVGEGGGL